MVAKPEVASDLVAFVVTKEKRKNAQSTRK